MPTKTKWDIRKAFKYNKRLLRFKKVVVLNGQYSSWASITAGVHQGLILGPLLLLIYVNDLSKKQSSNLKLFADDTSLFQLSII